MKSKTYEIIIVIVVLSLLAACFGCKDKVEAEEIEFTCEIVEPNETYILELTADYEIIIQEPNYLVVDLWDKGGWYINDEESGITISNRRRIEVKKPYIMKEQRPGYLRVDPPEPNKIKFEYQDELADDTIELYEAPSPPEVSVDMFDILLKCIPTWPDYIELEKNLLIDMPHKMWYGTSAFQNYCFPKGTKIYFKED